MNHAMIAWLRNFTPILILLAAVGAYVGLSNLRKPPQRVEVVAPSLELETSRVAAHEGELPLRVDGVVVPWREVTLAAEVAGRITFKAPQCRAGRFVKQGDLLLQIEAENYELELQRLAQEYAQAVASLAELDVQIASTEQLYQLLHEDWSLQRRELERQLNLGAGTVSESALDQTRRAEVASRNQLIDMQNKLRLQKTQRTRLESMIELAKIRRERAQLDVERTHIRSPVDGVVVSDAIEAGSFAQAGATLVTIEDTSAMEVLCNLRLDQLEWIWAQNGRRESVEQADRYELPETKAVVSYRIGAREWRWNGVLWRTTGTGLDERTRMAQVLVRVDDPAGVTDRSGAPIAGAPALVRGMFVEVTIEAQVREPLLRVSEQAIQPGGFVYRLRNGQPSSQRVRIVQVLGDDVVVAIEGDALRVGDEVVQGPTAARLRGLSPQPTLAATEQPVR